MKRLLILFSIIGLWHSLLAERPIVVVLSMDAFRHDYHSSIGTPFLDSIAAKGIKADAFIPCFPTLTFPNHYAMATGLHPNHNGLPHNTFFNKDIQCQYRIGDRDAVGDGRFYKGEPIWLTAHKHGLQTASCFWVGSETPIQGYQPDRWKLFDSKMSFESRIDTVVSWLRLPEAERPDLVMFYFDEPDHTTHNLYPEEDRSRAMIRRCDSMVGLCDRKLQALPCSDRIHFIIVSDHGMCPLSPDRVIELDPILPKRFYTYNNFGTPCRLMDIIPEKLDSALILLASIPHLNAWKASEVPAHLNYGSDPNIGNLVVLADSGYAFVTKDRPLRMRGAHGYDHRNSDMHGILYAYGPQFKSQFKMSPLPNIQLYNIIARILGIAGAPNDADPKQIDDLFISPKDTKIYKH